MNDWGTGISSVSFLKLGMYLYENQQKIDEKEQLKKDNKIEELEILTDTIQGLKLTRNNIINKINKLSNKKKIIINNNNKMSSSSYNIILLENNKLRNEYELNKKLLNEEILLKNTIDESIKHIEYKIYILKCYIF